MARERWQPPPMKSPAPPESAKKDSPKVTVDENVVRKMLKVNPTLRQGRTTHQVKKSLERGDSLMGESAKGSAGVSSPEPARPANLPSGAAELRDAVGFFLRSKLDALNAREADIEARRKALADELEAARAALRDQVQSFLGLLDQSALAQHGPAALAEHAKALSKVGFDTAAAIEAARRGKK